MVYLYRSVNLLIGEFLEFEELGFEEVFIDDLSSLGSWVEHPDIKDALEEVVAGQEEEDKAENLVEGSKETEYNPIG